MYIYSIFCMYVLQTQTFHVNITMFTNNGEKSEKKCPWNVPAETLKMTPVVTMVTSSAA